MIEKWQPVWTTCRVYESGTASMRLYRFREMRVIETAIKELVKISENIAISAVLKNTPYWYVPAVFELGFPSRRLQKFFSKKIREAFGEKQNGRTKK